MDQRKDYTPYWLSALAASAMLATLVAVGLSPRPVGERAGGPSPDFSFPDEPWPTKTHRATPPSPAPIQAWAPVPAVQVLSSLHCPADAFPAEWEIMADLERSLNAPSSLPLDAGLVNDLVSRLPLGPVEVQQPGDVDPANLLPNTPLLVGIESAEIVEVLPSTPRWKAGYRKLPQMTPSPLPSIDGAQVAVLLGKWVGAVQNPSLRLADLLARVDFGSAVAVPEKVVSSPPALTGPLLTEPGDRLAMAPRRQGATVMAPLPKPEAAGPEKPAEPDGLPKPADLLAKLAELAMEEKTADWARRAEAAVRRAVSPEETVDAPIEALNEISREGLELADRLDASSEDRRLAVSVRRACYAIERRAAAWWIVAALDFCGGNAVVENPRPEDFRFAMAAPVKALGNGIAPSGRRLPGATQLLQRLETYESDGGPRLAKLIAQDAQVLANSGSDLHRGLAKEIQQQYRNANLRVAVAGAMLQRYLPEPAPAVDPVHDRIAGQLVRGRSHTKTDLAIRLLPDPYFWRLGLEARGTVRASTYANPSPVVLQNRSSTAFYGRKMITVGANGVHAAPSLCKATSRTRLVGLRSGYDDVLLIGDLVRMRARDEYSARRGIARRQTENRVETRVRRSIDQQSAPLLAKLEQAYASRVVGRATALGMKVEPVEMRTTDKRLIARLRVADDRQLAAHTPRTRAPSDSLTSVQMHQSVLNNIVDGLELGGRAWTPRELRSHVHRKLHLPDSGAEPSQEKASFVFDPAEPVRIVFSEGQAELVLAIRELTIGKNRYRPFKVHAFYRPEAEGIEARMVREGGLQIEGRMRSASRLQLHGVFGQVLGEDRAIDLLPLAPGDESKLAGLKVTQLVIDDGWLGLAIGPAEEGRRVAAIGAYVR